MGIPRDQTHPITGKRCDTAERSRVLRELGNERERERTARAASDAPLNHNAFVHHERALRHESDVKQLANDPTLREDERARALRALDSAFQFAGVDARATPSQTTPTTAIEKAVERIRVERKLSTFTEALTVYMRENPAGYEQYRHDVLTGGRPGAGTASAVVVKFDSLVSEHRRLHQCSTADAIIATAAKNPELARERNAAISLGL